MPCLLPEGFEQLGMLQDLNLSRCKKMDITATVNILIKLPVLTKLSLQDWEMAELPEGREMRLFWIRTNCSPVPLSEGFGQLRNLQNLNLEECNNLALPESFIQLTSLPDENFLKCCKHVAKLPESIVEHPLLKDATELDLSSSPLVALPNSESRLPLCFSRWD